MLGIFKYNSIGQIMVIIVATAALWAGAFANPVTMPSSRFFSPLYDCLYSWLCDCPRVASATALVLVLIEGVWLNIMFVNKKICSASSLLPLFMYIVAMSWGHYSMTLTPMVMVNLFVLMATGQLLTDGGNTLGFDRIFNATFCIGLATMFYLPAISYLIPLALVFVIYKLYRWRDLTVAILGLIAPIIVLTTYAFLVGKLDYYSILIRHDLVDMHMQLGSAGVVETCCCIVFVVLLVVMLLHMATKANEGTISQRINTGIMLLPLIAVVLMLLYRKLLPLDPQSAAITFSFASYVFFTAERKRAWIGEALLWILLTSCCVEMIVGL